MAERLLDKLLKEYGVSHQNQTNKLIHWVCVPTIMFSLFGLLMSIPFPVEKTIYFNWGTIFFISALLYYLKLSFVMFLSFIVIGGLMIFGNSTILHFFENNSFTLFIFSLSLFIGAWIGQFIGHKIEGQKPSFLKDLQFLLIGPAWLLHFIFKKSGVKY